MEFFSLFNFNSSDLHLNSHAANGYYIRTAHTYSVTEKIILSHKTLSYMPTSLQVDCVAWFLSRVTEHSQRHLLNAWFRLVPSTTVNYNYPICREGNWVTERRCNLLIYNEARIWADIHAAPKPVCSSATPGMGKWRPVFHTASF